MSNIITKIRKIWDRLSEKPYREAYIAANINESLSAQIYALREHRGWTQADLAHKTKMAQPRISMLEESCEGVSVATLKRLASAFDVGLTIQFVPFSKIVDTVTNDRLDAPIPSFQDDTIIKETKNAPLLETKSFVNVMTTNPNPTTFVNLQTLAPTHHAQLESHTYVTCH